MKKSIITLENKKQISTLELIASIDQRIIIETTTYLQTDGTILKTSIQKDIYNMELSFDCLNTFFDSQLNALVEFYRVQGEFKLTIK